jgi:hypothetical protein
MTSRPSSVALAGLLGLLVMGCGDEPDRAAKPPKATTTATATTPTDVDQYLLRADEVPDLKPILSPQTDTGEPFDLSSEGTELLERSGYISTTYQPAEGHGAGVSSVVLFDSEAGARDWLAYETSDEAIRDQIPNTKINRFEVPDVPGATGWTGPDLHGNAIGTIYWTQGRCMLLISLEVEGPRVERLSAGAAAIYERTGGTCPD